MAPSPTPPPEYSWMCGLPLEHSWLIRGYTLREHWLFLPQQLTTPNTTSSFYAGMWFGLVLTGLLYAVITTVSSLVKLPVCPEDTGFCGHPFPLALSTPSFHNDPWALGVKDVIYKFPFRAKHAVYSILFSAPVGQLLSVLLSTANRSFSDEEFQKFLNQSVYYVNWAK